MNNQCVATKFHLGSEKPSWRKVSQEQKESYKVNLDLLLNEIHVPDSVQNCRNIHCKYEKHCEELLTHILEVVKQSANDSLPVIKPSIRKNTNPKPGWNSEVKPFQDNAYFWSQV